MKKSIVLMLSLMLVLTACGSKEKETAAPAESKPATTQESPKETPKKSDTEKMETAETKEFSFSYPASWKAYDLSQLNQPAIKAAYVDSAPKGGFADNVNVTMDGTTTTAKETADLTNSQYESGAVGDTMKDYKKISYTDTPNNTGVLVGEYTQGQSGVQAILTQYIVPTGSQTYSLSITYSKDSYNNGGKEMAQKMIDSFKLSGTAAATEPEKASTDGAAVTANPGTGEVTFADVMVKLVPTITENDGEMTEKTYNYIVAHSDLFPALTPESKKTAMSLVDANITTRHLFKNVTPYLDKMVQVTGSVVEVYEEETEIGTLAAIHVLDNNGKSVLGWYMNSTGDILEGDDVTMYGLPTSIFSFDNGGGTTNALLMSVSTVQKVQ
ncbi:hypothetical protein MUG84_09175 [Paenibacillus sp. KQZ6P-2]|uniref:PsbP C-terminal domain-containing protein n=1 Tax=Paenibacillus mangrovi TaxID=2931978 RepID=A0A9X2B4R4_9BACL|nr:PsbP-related protein [Paenibacillus mangrovi]MCJ8011912.1 hypothetical protein [Paenibacillus mangrovi]